MPEQELRRALDELRNEIDRLTDSDADSRERLESLVSDIEHRLDNPDEDGEDGDLMSNLSDGIAHFEVEHPRATGILNDIMVALGNLGI